MFGLEVDGRRVGLPDLFEGFTEHDRLGVVVAAPCGAVGASALIAATVTAFYDIQRARGGDFFVYPDYYLFHVERPRGEHAQLDVWPPHKEVVVADEPEAILEAVVDRAITRLVVEDGPPGAPSLEAESLASAQARIATCLAYSPSGRVADADIRITSNPVTEGYVQAILDPETRLERLKAEGDTDLVPAIESRIGEVGPELRRRILAARGELVEDGVPVETYRRIGLDEALARLG
jgi:hypothetical protein